MEKEMKRKFQVSRRAFLKGGAAASTALAFGGAPHIARAQPSSIVVASSGGKLEEAYKTAYYGPWTEKTGIEVVGTANTYAKLKAMVDANSVEWDVAQLDAAVAASFAAQGLLEPLDYSVIDKSNFFPGIARDYYLPSDVAGCVIAWNTELVKGEAAPKTWADVWDLQRISGQRGFWKQPFQTLELALMADGVSLDKLYPLDVDRAFASLDKIKSEIFWWGSGSQSAQILVNGEIPVEMGWNGRLYDLKKDGAPVDYHFNQSLFVSDAWVIPKGSSNKKAAMEFIAFASQAETQAAYSEAIPYGPVNKEALKLIGEKRLPDIPSSEQNFQLGVLQDFDWWAENGEKVGSRFNNWLLG